MTHVSQDEVLLLWRALVRFRSGSRSACAPRGRPQRSNCPLYAQCPRWAERDDQRQTYDETFEQTEQRRASWPCTRLLDALRPDVSYIR
jgi:hypothetical protein